MKAKNASIAPVQIDIDDGLTAKEAAAIAHTSVGTIYHWAKDGYFMSWTVKDIRCWREALDTSIAPASWPSYKMDLTIFVLK